MGEWFAGPPFDRKQKVRSARGAGPSWCARVVRGFRGVLWGLSPSVHWPLPWWDGAEGRGRCLEAHGTY